MKHFLTSLVVVGMLFNAVLAEPMPPVTTVDDSVQTTLDEAFQHAENAGTFINNNLAPAVGESMEEFYIFIPLLADQDVDVTELEALFKTAERHYNAACTKFNKSRTYMRLGDFLAREAEDAIGTAIHVLRIKATFCVYEAVLCLESARVSLEKCLEICEDGAILIEKLKAKPVDINNKSAGRYHLRKRVK